jgi:hypothetical protein
MVTNYDKDRLRLEVQELPSNLDVGSICKLLILSSPTPCEFLGRITKEGAKRPIVMYKGQARSKRSDERHDVNLPAYIEAMIFDGHSYILFSHLEVELINISKSGVRFRSPLDSFCSGHIFRMRMRIGDKDKLLISEVTNYFDKGSEWSEYGCRFLTSYEGR